jgi:hypothetical protein
VSRFLTPIRFGVGRTWKTWYGFGADLVQRGRPSVWWEEKRAELEDAAGAGPVLVWDGETLNDLVFDLLSLDCVDGVLFDTRLGAHPRLLGALGRLGSGFLCRSGEEVGRVLRYALADPASCVLLAGGTDPGKAVAGLPPGVMVAVPLGEALAPEGLRGREVLVVPAPAPADASRIRNRLRVLERVQARVRGFHLHPFAAAGETAPPTAEWPLIAGGDGILVPGGGAGLVLDRETGAPDLAATTERLEAWKALLPEGELRVEPGAGFFAAAAALAEKEGGKARVRAPAPLGPRRGAVAGPEELPGPPLREGQGGKGDETWPTRPSGWSGRRTSGPSPSTARSS